MEQSAHRRDAIEAERRRLEPDTFSQEFEGKFVGSGIPQCETCGYVHGAAAPQVEKVGGHEDPAPPPAAEAAEDGVAEAARAGIHGVRN